MFQDVSNAGLEGKTQLNPCSSSLFDDVYNSVSSSFRSLKETVVENPYTSAAIGLAATAGALYLTRGKLWGVAAETEGTLFKLSSRSPEWGASLHGVPHSPHDPALLTRVRIAAQDDLRSKSWLKAKLNLPQDYDFNRSFSVRLPILREPQLTHAEQLARIQNAAKGDLNGIKKFALDPNGKKPVHPFPKDKLFGPDIKKDTLTGDGANGARISGLAGAADVGARASDLAKTFRNKSF